MIEFLQMIWERIRQVYENDKVAFVIFLCMFTILVLFWTPLVFGTGWVTLFYLVTLFLAARKGEKIAFEKSFAFAMKNLKRQRQAEQAQAEKAREPQPQKRSEQPEAQQPEPSAQTPVETEPEKQEPVKQPVKKKPAVVSFVGDFLSDSNKQALDALDIEVIQEQIQSRIKGQDHAIEAVISTLKRAVAGVSVKKEKPLCVFLFLGATGTGKTEIVKQISEASGRPLVRFDMPNYSSEAGIWELIGSPPGYIGSDKPGRLTSEILNNPNAVLLLDEIEKAHKKMWDPFLRVLDEGKLRDQSQGFTANFKNVLIFLTSNILQFEDFIDDEKELRNKVLTENYFRPELLNRIDRIVMFKRFDRDTYIEIITLSLRNYIESFLSANRLDADVKIDKSVIEHVLKNIDMKFGVRDVHRFIEKNLGDAISEAWLERKNKEVTEISISVADEKIEVKI